MFKQVQLRQKVLQILLLLKQQLLDHQAAQVHQVIVQIHQTVLHQIQITAIILQSIPVVVVKTTHHQVTCMQ